MRPSLLIVSDVHLCRLRPGMIAGGQRELARFLDHHATHRDGEHPWRLVCNGDLFDFDHQAVGMARRGREAASLELLAEVAAEFPEVLAALARFLDHGHEIVVIPGNHDFDLMWPSVRAAFTARVAADLADPAAMERLSFRDWFYYEPDRVFVEHGQQYDLDTSVAGLLAPFDEAPAGKGLRTNLGTHWISGFCPLIPEIAYHVDHTRSPLYYLPVIAARYGPRGPWLLVRYLAFALRTVLAAGPAQARAHPEHAHRRTALAAEAGTPAATLEALDALAAAPRLGSRASTAARLHLVAALCLPLGLALGIAALALGSPAVGIVAGGAFFAAALASLLGGGRYAGHAERAARAAAAEVQRMLDVPVVSFGHVHVATDEPCGTGRYLNSGTWLSPHLPLSYVRIDTEGASLRTWQPRQMTARDSETER